jgi:hypothetical protein
MDKHSSSVMKNVTKYTRAGENGKWIVCPLCGKKQRVYHFSFAACTCQSCKKLVSKYDWLLEH